MFRLAYVLHAICSSNYLRTNPSSLTRNHTNISCDTQEYNPCINEINAIDFVGNDIETYTSFEKCSKNNIPDNEHEERHELNANYDHKFCKNKNEFINNKIDYRNNHLDCNIQAMIGQNGDDCRTLKNNDKTRDRAKIANDFYENLYSRYLADDEYLKHEYDVMTMIYSSSSSLKFVD
ncbi:hypothetical protein COBT_003273, partial [Conglomerata obtusa]